MNAVAYRLQVEAGHWGTAMEAAVRFVGEPESSLADRRRKVWLECDGEPYDFRSVVVLRTDFLVHDIEFVKFVCPHCGKKHQSLLFS
jgi:hypothetical protein